jgi:hypothetical protein
MTSTYVSDEVWTRLDPSAARLSRATRIKVTLWCLLASVIAFVVLILTASGLFIPRFTVGYGGGGGGSFTSCWQAMAIKNTGWFDEHVITATLQPHGTGATLTRSLDGSNLPSGASRVIRLHFAGSVCREILTAPVFQNGAFAPPDLTVQLRRPWGTSTATIRLVPRNDDGLTVHW